VKRVGFGHDTVTVDAFLVRGVIAHGKGGTG
jgi:hypothetical protein